ncbi:MAG: GNAT family N-acetyltransferase [Acidobacteriota bacterium]
MDHPIIVRDASLSDAPALAALRTAVADSLTSEHGKGHWSSPVSVDGQIRAITTSRVLVAVVGKTVTGTLRLVRKKPWAIDPAWFAKSKQPLYLLDMAVAPPAQRQGLGRILLAEAVRAAQEIGADAIRLDAYDGPAGAGEFYARCGFTEMGRVVYRGVPLVYYQLLIQAG